MGRLAPAAVALLLAVSLGLGAVASAQEPPPPSTTTTTTAAESTTTTSAPPPPSSTTTTAPPDPGAIPTTTTTAPPPPDDPTAYGDAPSDTVPAVDITVPPRTGPYADQVPLSQAIHRQLRVARATALQSAAVHQAAVAKVQRLEAEQSNLIRRVGSLRVEQQAAIRRLARARDTLAQRAADAYVRGGPSGITSALGANDPNVYLRSVALMRSVLDADIGAVDELKAARAALTGDLAKVVDELEANDEALLDARRVEQESAAAAESAQFELLVFSAGSEIVITGFTFPVDDPHTFTDSFGAPRLAGTPLEHYHEGTDILAPRGTRLFATERGVITKMGSDPLGGIKLWLKGESNTSYYYAHLTGYASGLKQGMVVEAGTVLGFVGDTGDALGGPTHLHFEIHPDGGPAVNPYPLLKVVDDLRKKAEQAKT